MKSLILLFTLFSSFAFAQDTWVRCAREGGTCVVSGKQVVRYGANGKFVEKTFSKSTPCTNRVFGNPIPNVVKECSIKKVVTSPVTGWTTCAVENAVCSFSGTKSVRYGANNSWKILTFSNGTKCSNAVFGDPLVGVVKSCQIQNAVAPTPTPVPAPSLSIVSPSSGSTVKANAQVSISATASNATKVSFYINNSLLCEKAASPYSCSYAAPTSAQTVTIKGVAVNSAGVSVQQSLSINIVVETTPPPPAASASYYIDFQNGSDSNDGKTAASAWKRAPGDPLAVGNALGTKLVSGESLIFRGGVFYDGNIAIASGVKYLGTGWGAGKAIIRGSEKIPTQLVRCASAAECGGNANFANIYYTTLPASVPDFTQGFFENGKLLSYGQFPNQPDGIDYDNLKYFSTIPLNSPTIKQTETTITDPRVFTQADSTFWVGASVALWVYPNYVQIKKITAYNPSTNTITHEALDAANGITKYNDRDSRYAILNHSSLIDIPGEYVVDKVKNRLYIWPLNGNPSSLEYRYLARNDAFLDNWKTPTNVTVDGFEITQFRQGIIIPSEGASNILVQNNFIHQLQSSDGSAISISGNYNVIQDNNIFRGRRSIGILTNGLEIRIQRNVVDTTSRQGIWIMNGKNGRIIGNTVKNLHGAHANGISVYLGSSNILVANNKVLDCDSPITSERTENLTLYGNFVNNGGFNEWFGATGTLRIINNTFVNSVNGFAVGLSASAAKPVMVNNIVGGGGVKEPVHIYNLYTELAWSQDIRYGWSLATGEDMVSDLSKIFVNALNGNYAPLAGGPAHSMGINPSAYLPLADYPGFDWNKDMNGKSRNDDNAWEIGAFAY